MRVTAIVLFLSMLACSGPDLKDTIFTKINLFTTHENEHFKNISITPLSRGEKKGKPKEFQILKKEKQSFAAIQILPENRILKNFYSDSITQDFVKVFSELGLTRLYSYDEVINDSTSFNQITHLEFHFGNEIIILFRENPYQTQDAVQTIIDRSTGLTGKWRFTTFPKN